MSPGCGAVGCGIHRVSEVIKLLGCFSVFGDGDICLNFFVHLLYGIDSVCQSEGYAVIWFSVVSVGAYGGKLV